MILLYMVALPFVMTTWTQEPLGAFAFTLASAMCFWSLEFIAAELENPFGNDVNDLPVFGFQEDVNQGLLLLVHPMTAGLYDLDESGKAVGGSWNKIDSTGISMEKEMEEVEKALEKVGEFQERQAEEHHQQACSDSKPAESARPAPVTKPVADLADGNAKPIQSLGIDIDSLALTVLPAKPPETAKAQKVCAPPPASLAQRSLLDISWVEHFMQQQRNLDRDLLERLDTIVRAVTTKDPSDHRTLPYKHVDSAYGGNGTLDPLHANL